MQLGSTPGTKAGHGWLRLFVGTGITLVALGVGTAFWHYKQAQNQVRSHMAVARHAYLIQEFHEEFRRLPSRAEWEERAAAMGLPMEDGWGRALQYTIVDRERTTCCRGQWAFFIMSFGSDGTADYSEPCAALCDELPPPRSLEYEGDLIAGGRLHPAEDRTRVRKEFVQTIGK